ncbi:FG-GAP repeat domain-containing protein [Actinacidiphila acidipaludis]|uniref:VCBS repeat-containing protein n=1 Tax=Actinacidiphila acidipaludis TaxID=2873382 RepID=A0ABS7QAP6_9ACTN|nr:VCBS repeat-containing protein [Streptomyces acidipaludis]MBY8880211.1 VCBS repeat-containing protein [Streptomyces acidipaludis]
MQWDGQTWSPVTDPALPAVQEWSAISAASANDVWAYGTVSTITGGTQYIAHFDGRRWSAVEAAGPLDRDWIEVPLKAVPGRVFEGGNALYTYSDGAWQTFSLPEGVDIRGIDALSADDAYATGMNFRAEDEPVLYHWDGTTWTPITAPTPAGVPMAAIAATSADDIYIGGWDQSGAMRTRVQHWDGSSWHDVTGALSDYYLESLRPDGQGGLWAAGGDYSTLMSDAVLWHYDGATWTKQAGAAIPDAGPRTSYFHDVAPIDGAGGSRFLAVGDYDGQPTSPQDSAPEHGLVEETQSALDLTTADVSASSTATHTVRVHAESAGRLTVAFRPADGQPDWSDSTVDLKVTSVSGGSQGACDHVMGAVNGAAEAVSCDLPAGDHTIGYTVAAGANVDAWQLTADVRFQASDAGAANPEATAGFAVVAAPRTSAATRFLGRDAAGTLWRYDGTGNASAPYQARVAVGNGWQGYDAITALSNLTVHGVGDMVARDTSGVLWYYRGGGDARPFEARAKVGAGWSIYNSLVGAGDLNGDGRADLLARDTSGVLWLYPGTSSATAPFAARVKIGAGWNAYNPLAGTGDLTGDGRADLLATDASGALWLYQGTGSAAAPFARPTKVGTGWGVYDALVVPGDLTGDGRADILGRDVYGVLYLYRGTGNAQAPYAARENVGSGWSVYNKLV